MNLGMIKGLVGTVAPKLATVLAEKLGVKNEPKAIEQAIQNATPEQLQAIKEAELELEAKLAQMEVDIFALETADTQDARKAHKGDWTPKVFGMVSLVSFVSYIFLVTIQPPDQNSEAVINLVLGYFGGVISAIVSYFYGSSNKKDD